MGNAIAPDGSDDSEDEDMAMPKGRGLRKRTSSAADQVKSILDNIAPDDDDSSSEDDQIAHIHKKKHSQPLVQSITSPQHNVGVGSTDDDLENEKVRKRKARSRKNTLD